MSSEQIGEPFIAVIVSWLALAPGQLRFGEGAFRDERSYTIPRWRERVIRSIALAIALVVWLDLFLQVTGRPRLLH